MLLCWVICSYVIFDVSKALAGKEGALQATTFGFQF